MDRGACGDRGERYIKMKRGAWREIEKEGARELARHSTRRVRRGRKTKGTSRAGMLCYL
jgi:hypothetical protein